MARRRRSVPVVGPKQLHPVQIDPQTRRLEARRTKAAAQREYAPTIAADKSERGLVKKTYRNEAQSARGATNAVEDALAQALSGLQGSGLTGGYLRQVKNEFTSRAGDAAAALPSLLAGAGEERNKGLAEVAQQITQDRAARDTSAAGAYNERLKELRTAGSSALKEEQKKRESEHSGLSKEEKTKLEQAANAIRDSLNVWSKNEPVPINGEEKTPKEINPLKTGEDWLKFAHGIEKEYDGVSLSDAMKVIRKLLARRQESEHKGRFPQPGVPTGPRQDFGL